MYSELKVPNLELVENLAWHLMREYEQTARMGLIYSEHSVWNLSSQTQYHNFEIWKEK